MAEPVGGARPGTGAMVVPPHDTFDRTENRRAILRLAVPMGVAAVVGVALPLVVMALMGRMSDQALYVRSLYLPLALLFVALHTAFDVSNLSLAAICRGRDRLQDVLPVAVNMGRMATGVGGLLCALLFAGGPLLADLLAVAPHATADFVWFLRWTAFANLLMVVPMLAASSLRGVGHAKAAMLITLTTAVIEIGGIVLFGLVGGLGMFVVPASIAVSGVIGSVLGLRLLRHHGIRRSRRPAELWPETVEHIRQIGIPVALSFVIMFALSVIQLRLLGRFGPEVVSGFSTAVTVQSIVVEPAIALGSATAVVMNQLRGACQVTRLSGTLRSGLEIAAGAYAMIALLIWLGSGPLGRLSTTNQQIAAEAATYLRVVAPTLIVMGMLILAITVLEQTGGGMVALGLNVLYLLGVAAAGSATLAVFDEPVWLYRVVALMNVGGLVVVVASVLYVRRIGAVTIALANRVKGSL